MAGNGVWKPGDTTLTTFSKPVLHVIVGAASKNAGRRAVNYIKEELAAVDRVDSGELRDSYESDTVITPMGVRFEVYSTLPPVSQYIQGAYSDRTLEDIVNRGTGIYGPYGTPIVSPNGGVMSFRWGRKSGNLSARNVRNNTGPGGGGRFENNMMYAYSVKGQAATGYLDRALSRIKITDYVTPA